MDENRLRFGVGVLVISAIGIGIILTFLFGAFPSVLQRDYSLSVVFDSAEGIGANTPVVRDGVRIGRVSSISLRDEGGVLVTLAMDATKQVSHSYIPRIGTGNFVTGDAQLEFVRGKPAKLRSIWDANGKAEDYPEILGQPYIDGEYFSKGENSESLFEMQSDLQETFEAIRNAGSSIAVAAESINKLASGVEKVVGGSDSKIEQVADEAVQALREFNGAMTDIREIVNNPVIRENLEESVVQLPEVLKQAKKRLMPPQRTFDSFERVGKQFEKVGEAAVDTVHSAQRTVKNVEQFTEPLATHGDELVDQVLTTMARLDSTLTEVMSLVKRSTTKTARCVCCLMTRKCTGRFAARLRTLKALPQGSGRFLTTCACSPTKLQEILGN